MQDWQQLVWDRPPETDVHRDRPRAPYEERERQLTSTNLGRRNLRISDFVSQYAIGDSIASSLELLVRSRRLIEQSNALALRIRMRLLLSRSGKSAQ